MRYIVNDIIEIDGNTFEKEDIGNLYRLQRALLVEENIVATLNECFLIWSGYSNDLAASWLFFPKENEEIISYIKNNDYFISFENYLK